MYILLLDTQKKFNEYLRSITEEEVKAIRFILIAEDLNIDNLPKKAKVKAMHFLMPPLYILTKFFKDIQDAHGKKEREEAENNYLDSYYQYLTSPQCVIGFNYIARKYILNKKNIVLCFGDMEKEYKLHKIVTDSFLNIYSDFKIFTFKDWEKNPQKVIKYKPENINRIEQEIIEDTVALGRKVMEAQACDNEASKFDMFKP